MADLREKSWVALRISWENLCIWVSLSLAGMLMLYEP